MMPTPSRTLRVAARAAALSVALAAAFAFCVPSAAPRDLGAAHAQDKDGKGRKNGGEKGEGGKGGGDKDGKEKKDPKDAPQWKLVQKVADEFAAKDAAALVARIEPKTKLRLSIGELKDRTQVSGDYGADQAKALLQSWFSEKGAITVSVTKVEGDTGICAMRVKVAGKDKEFVHELHVKLRKKDGAEDWWLAGLEKA